MCAIWHVLVFLFEEVGVKHKVLALWYRYKFTSKSNSLLGSLPIMSHIAWRALPIDFLPCSGIHELAFLYSG